MQNSKGDIVSKWDNNYTKLANKVVNGKRTLIDAKKYMEKEYVYTGSSRKAFSYLMYAHPNDIALENKLYLQICEAIKLGFGNDVDFKRVFS